MAGAGEVGDDRRVFHFDQGGEGELDGTWGSHRRKASLFKEEEERSGETEESAGK
jgi:hypothetical protein